eukprot:813813-Rhodomonas_salina.2
MADSPAYRAQCTARPRDMSSTAVQLRRQHQVSVPEALAASKQLLYVRIWLTAQPPAQTHTHSGSTF